MKNVLRPFLVPTLATLVVGFACTPTNAARRVGVSPYDGTWSVAIYTLRGDCGSIRVAARIVGSRVYSEDQSYQASGVVSANGAVRVSVTGAGRSASGWGRLSRSSGAGRWRSSRGECSGTWSASRRAGNLLRVASSCSNETSRYGTCPTRGTEWRYSGLSFG
jgi:hypothetical protein